MKKIKQSLFIAIIVFAFCSTSNISAQTQIDVNACIWIHIDSYLDENGVQTTDYQFINPPDGYFQFFDYSSGSVLIMEGEIAGALKQGEWTYFISGFADQKINYINSVENGPYEAYYRNGNLRIKATFKDGLFDGYFYSYNQNGELVRLENLENGILVTE